MKKSKMKKSKQRPKTRPENRTMAVDDYIQKNYGKRIEAGFKLLGETM